MQVVLNNTPEERRQLLAALQTFAEQNQLSPAVVQAADLVLEEHVTNVMNYAYEDSLPHQIRVRLEIEGQDFLIEIADDGRPFNPLLKPEVDTSLPLEERPIGGLGIHLMRRFMDKLDYRRDAGLNVLVMRKKLG